MNIIEHIENFLGKVSRGWKDNNSNSDVQIICIENSPYQFVNTFLTLGMSNHVLKLAGEKKVRQELIMPLSCTITPSEKWVVSCLLYICELILKNHEAPLRGQVLHLPSKITDNLGIDAVYCAIPMFLDESFSIFRESDPPTIMIWVIPIYKSEVDFINSNGWEKFEDILESKNPNLFTVKRDLIT